MISLIFFSLGNVAISVNDISPSPILAAALRVKASFPVSIKAAKA